MNIISVDWNTGESKRFGARQPELAQDVGRLTVRLLNVEINAASPPANDATHDQYIGRASISSDFLSATPRAEQLREEVNASDLIASDALATAILQQQIETPIARGQDASVLGMSVQDSCISLPRVSTPDVVLLKAQRAALDLGPPATTISIGKDVPKAEEVASKEQKSIANNNSSPLRKAILAPDMHTRKVDRDRAIGLRWVLRDIAANRLRLSPASASDLRTLVDLKLIELKDDIILTSDGVIAVRCPPEK